MLSPWSPWALPVLLVLGLAASLGDAHYPHHSPSSDASHPISHEEVYYTNTTVFHTTTDVLSTTISTTHYVDTTVPHYVNHTISSTETNIVKTFITEYVTTTLHATVSTTETDFATITNTQTTTATVPATITTFTTRTMLSTTYDPCPTTCSLSAGTVSLFFWPTDRPYTYFSTYVETNLDYTFTSPSVYMLIPTVVGINSLGRAGPSTSDWMLPLDLNEVSTIVDGTLTRQLSLSDLGTDCPMTAEPSAIATMVDSRCDPILAAPHQVSAWAAPCNACGRFGLFDPPYAVPTLTGGLVESTVTPEPVQTTAAPAPTPTTEAASTSDTPTESVVAPEEPSTTTTSAELPIITATSDELPIITSTSDALPTITSEASLSTSAEASLPTSAEAPLPTSAEASPSTSATLLPTSVVTAAAANVKGELVWLIASVLATMLLL